ncbi:hypothetical protein PHYPSEUDO_002204 [Phytophthora pseudosyringae]|uniref:Uncharacterized protein n=1 Tax=Phytophthora pseudosyringae TaxID=221518 RepID=A0A8T1VX45_9STRA|nr:hypothetical protein PHYPSEUDO_002204 [Phytophthora pseudosyringae]
MLRSLQILQFALQLTVLLLVVVAVHLHSWAVVELQNVDRPSANPAKQLTFAPDGYCLRLSNGSAECQPFLHAIVDNSRQPDAWLSAGPDALAVHRESNNASSQDFVATEALSCWCHTRGELTWYMQGAHNVACLVVLETVKYAMALWGFFATVSLGLSSISSPRSFVACHAFSSFTSALLGFLVTLVWWYYSSTYIDREYLDELALNWHHGASYHCALVAFALATANAQIAFDATGPAGAPKYTRRFIRPTSRTEQPDDWDPLSCPANYLV